MIPNYKTTWASFLANFWYRTGSAWRMEAPCGGAWALQRARVKSAILLAAITALAILSPPCTVGLSAAAVVSLSPTSLALGKQTAGTTSPAHTITLKNIGNAALSITGVAITGANASNFAQTSNCGSPVAARATCAINVVFTPSAAGISSASLTISDNASSGSQTVSLTGVGLVPAIYLSSTSLSFGNQSVGTTSAAQTLSVRNTGSGVLEIESLAFTGTNSGDFAQTNNCGSSVGSGGRCTISVTFKPTASGSSEASLKITDNGSGSPQAISLSGTGTDPRPAATPTFSIPSGTYSSPQTVTISDATTGATIYYTTNGTTPTTTSTKYTGTITVISTETIEAIAIASGYSTSPVATATYTFSPPAATPSFSVAAGTYTSTQRVTISDATTGATIYYTTNGTTPTTSSTPYSGALTVSSTETIEAIATASGYSTSPVATATYTISMPIASLSSTSLAFGNEPLDMTSAAQTVTLSNTGSAALNITNVAITGANSGDFAEVAATCGTSLARGANCTIGVTFTPSLASGETASVTITDNASGSPQTVSLSGTGAHDVILSWTASGTSGIVGYNVYRGTTSGGESTTPLNSTPINGTTYTDTDVTARATYYYVVTAVGSGGVQSTASGETVATVP